MAISAGTQFGSFEILGLLGSGGMGEVYRARDTKLGREVAIKVLPPAFARDSERLARFRREAHLLATLNHPNIAAIYGFEEADGQLCLILELVEGETLADRVKREGPLPVEEVLEIVKQAFPGESVTDILGAVLHKEPDWAALPAAVPGSSQPSGSRRNSPFEPRYKM